MSQKNLALIIGLIILALGIYFIFAHKPQTVLAPSSSVDPLSSGANISIAVSSNSVAKNGDSVSVDYVGKFTSGEVFDTSIQSVAQSAGIYMTGRNYGPLEFKIGGGEMIKGFNDAVVGMKIGEKKTITLTPEQGYGNYDSSKIKTLSGSAFSDAGLSPKVGEMIQISPSDACSVTKIEGGMVTLDCNPPMAGKTLVFDLQLVSIK